MTMDLSSNSSDEGSDNESDNGSIEVVNKSKWDPPLDDSNESTAAETVSSLRDNGEGPSRPAQAAGGSPDDGGDGSDNGSSNSGRSVGGSGGGPSRLPQAPGGPPDDDGDDSGNGTSNPRSDSGYGSCNHSGDEDDDNDGDESVTPAIIEEEDDDDDEAYFSEDGPNNGDDITLWSHEKLIVEYRRKEDEIRDIKERGNRRIAHLRRTINDLRHRIREKDGSIAAFENSIIQLQREIQELRDRNRGIRPPPTSWTRLWRERDPYAVVYKAACQQLNMSQVTTNVHPQLTLSARRLGERQMRAAYSLDGGGDGHDNDNDNDNMPVDGEGANDGGGSDNESELFVRQDSPAPPAGQDVMPRRPFNFNGLDRDIQEHIFRYLFVKTDLVHCLSRLDPGNPPLVGKPLHRFFWAVIGSVPLP
ncbi:hypothetical protein PG994_006255 [Apiospora phragmitis]|uniref:Uncharacterized protein n=1 Tax=Apiospora phragmitis TaxID=2905665 RepID=A0ABR1VEJ1_9PEZI